MKTWFKRTFLPAGRHPRCIRGGLAKGAFMLLDLQNQLQRYLGLDERELIQPLKRCVSACRSFIDVGASDGYYTLIFLRANAGPVVACEPGSVGQRLIENAAVNGIRIGERFRLETRPVGLGDGAVPLAELLTSLSGPTLLKIDIEGGELTALRSAEGFARLNETRWVVETHSEKLETDCRDWFAAHGFTAEVVHNAWWRRFLPDLREGHNRWLVAEPRAARKLRQ